jgi:uncharacterized membrane protein
MNDIENTINRLAEKLNALRNGHMQMQADIRHIEEQLYMLQLKVKMPETQETVIHPALVSGPEITTAIPPIISKQPSPITQTFENFIGTNLISKVGILITIIGVFIGARYAIDKNLISPVTRILLAYGFAAALAITGLRLKLKYRSFSAILLGGSVAIIYFTTYLGYDFFNLFPRLVAFIIMLITTVGAIALALWYDLKIIALLGQVGAYAVPLLLSDGKGNPAVLFFYISFINAGLIILSFRKNWKIVYRTGFVITWAMYAFWVFEGDTSKLSWEWSLLFVSVSFVSFYVTYLSYKIYRNEQYNVGEIAILLLNGILFYFLGYTLIQNNTTGTNILTIFTLANAFIHLAACFGIYKADLADKSVKVFLLGQSLAFITIAIPVKLDGSWVTFLWSIEAAIIVFIANKTNRKIYYQIGAIVLLISIISLLQDWIYPDIGSAFPTRPFINEIFITYLVTVSCLLYAVILARKNDPALQTTPVFKIFYSSILPFLFLLILFIGPLRELEYYFNQLKTRYTDRSENYRSLQITMEIVYSLLFCAISLFVNNKLVKERRFFRLFFMAGFIVLAIQLSLGLYTLAQMRANYILNHQPYWLLWTRYINIATIAILWFNIFQGKKIFSVSTVLYKIISIAFNVTLLAVICNEYLHWVDLSGSSNQYKLGLSIICGSYALVILFIGLIRQIEHLRISAIILFAFTILKVFISDLRDMTTVSKTIIMIILGILLLVASFLYNKYVSVNIEKKESS